MAGQKDTRRQKDISRLIKERGKVARDKARRGKGRARPGR